LWRTTRSRGWDHQQQRSRRAGWAGRGRGVESCAVLFLSLDQLARDEAGRLLGGEFTSCDSLGHGGDALGIFVAGATGVGATKGMLLGVDGVILHEDDDGVRVVLVTCHKGHGPFCSNRNMRSR
jgi:hypothetical protein